MSEPKQKYEVVYAPRNPSILEQELVRSPTPTQDRITWGAQLSALYDAGYEIRSVRDEFIVMQFKENGLNDYSNVVDLKDVPPNEVGAHIEEGWEITSTSISTKFVRMVKRK